MSASWGCRTCLRIDEAPFLWLARRRSIAHERLDHGFSVYDPPQDARPDKWAEAQQGAGVGMSIYLRAALWLLAALAIVGSAFALLFVVVERFGMWGYMAIFGAVFLVGMYCRVLQLLREEAEHQVGTTASD